MDKPEDKLLRVGELAKAVGKTVRAMHLYEELGLLEPASRSDGGFRLYGADAVDRIHWIVKLQAIGFTLAEIQGFVHDFRDAGSGKQATDRARSVFAGKLDEIRAQITQLQVIENDLHEALAYLDSCQTCSTEFTPHECGVCGHNGHDRETAPRLFAGLSRRDVPARDGVAREFDVAATELVKDPEAAREPGRSRN
jgi:MerR family transcriptional regulator, copper efflux regulator